MVESKSEQQLDWNSLVLDVHPSREEIAEAVYTAGNNDGWQNLRASLHHTSMEQRFVTLFGWRQVNGQSRTSQVQVSNYVLALKRGGMWK